MGDSQHTQNIQINRVIGENKKTVSFILQENLSKLFGQPNSIYLCEVKNEAYIRYLEQYTVYRATCVITSHCNSRFLFFCGLNCIDSVTSVY